MNLDSTIKELDAEIAKLQHARSLIAGIDNVSKPKRGRPKGSTNAAPKKSRTITAAGRKKISDAMKARWAARRKTTK
jgi:hypothetical protein